MAGESASEVSRRKREKAARLTRDAELWERGAAGEAATARALAALPLNRWTVLHDVRWPGRRFANIDHVVVGPGGVFVIDSKNWSGRVEVRDGVLRQNGYRREREVAAAADSGLAVAKAVRGLGPRLVRPVLCLVTDEPVATYSREVLVCSTSTLVAQLLAQPAVLDVPTVRRVFGQVYRTLPSANAPRPLTNRRPSAYLPPTPVVRPPNGPVVPRTPRVVPRAARLLTLLAGLGIVSLFAVAAILGVVSAALSSLGDPDGRSTPGSGTGDAAAAKETLGDAHRFPRATGRPPLVVKPDRFVTTKAVGEAPYLFDGDRFVAIRISIKNSGQRTWTSQPGTDGVLTSELGAQAHAGSVRTTAGPPLPTTIQLGPGQSIRGWLTFQTSASRPVTGFTLTVGPGKPSSATWVIDRQ